LDGNFDPVFNRLLDSTALHVHVTRPRVGVENVPGARALGAIRGRTQPPAVPRVISHHGAGHLRGTVIAGI